MSETVTGRAGRREWLGVGVLVLVVMLLAIDGTVLSLAVPSLTEDLDPSADQILWIGDIYGFVLAGLLITMGNVADRIGRKRLLLIGTVAFGAASLLAAFAHDAETLIAARALLGVAGSTLMPSTLSIIRAMFTDDKQRTLAIAWWSAGATAGAAVGPLVGGFLLEHFWWGSVFLINLPVMALAFVGGLVILPESRGKRGAPIDLISSLLSILAIVPLVFAVKHVVADGVDALFITTLMVGLLAGWVLIRRQLRLSVPLIDVTLFRIPAFAGAFFANVLSIFGFFGLLFFFSQYLQMVLEFGTLKAGIAELPGTLASMVVIVFIGMLLARIGAGRSIGLGLALGALGLVVMSLTAEGPGYWGLGAGLVIVGFGVGIAMTLSTDAIVSAVPAERAGAASAVSETGFELGGALGIALLGSWNLAFYRTHLDLPGGASQIDRDAAQESLAAALHRADSAAVIDAAQEAFTTAMQSTAVVAAAILALAAVLAWRMIPSPAGR